MQFTKMHALGNDYILIDGIRYPEALKQGSEIAKKWSDRHFGVGSDGVIFACASDKANVMMRMFNADGSESEMCGNGIRQLARFVYEKNIVKKDRLIIETLAGLKEITMEREGENFRITVDMGAPILAPQEIPANVPADPKGFSKTMIQAADKTFEFTLVSMGNPHAITYVPSVKDVDVHRYGPLVENNTTIFPRRTNVEFIEVVSRDELRMRVWERGAGETLACGTGACASVVASILNGLTNKSVRVHLLGGPLDIRWDENSGHVIMTGDAVTVFEGEKEI
ncbi:diaminopimelate epimerase [Thermospira aquatica]|uniref:diaminopimelate epimerase n=1 Tax=Thermospira aquatica TaxID=2828656 RepID=UPI0038CD47CA